MYFIANYFLLSNPTAILSLVHGDNIRKKHCHLKLKFQGLSSEELPVERGATHSHITVCYNDLMKWKPAPLIKIYEALGSIADKRFEIHGNSAKVYSSSGNKYYDVVYDPAANAISSNDNGSFWVGYLGYPSIVLLCALDVVTYDPKLAEYLKGFAWKDINQRFKNDFSKTQQYIDRQIVDKYHIDLEAFHNSLEQIQQEVNALGLNKLTSDKKPPTAY